MRRDMRGTRPAAAGAARTGSGWTWPGRGPLLAAAGGFAALTVVMYGVNFRAAYGPPILVVAPVVGANAIMMLASWRAWRACAQPVGRRFWRAVSVSAAVSLVGMVVD